MKTLSKSFLLFYSLLFLVCYSCRKEEMEIINPPEEEALIANSPIVQLMLNTSLNDGSNDNIIDNASCFNIELPITVVVNDIEINVTSESDFETIEDIFDEFDEDDDNLEIVFPIVIILSDFSEVTINSFNEFNTFVSTCDGENEIDDDIECLDFQYPINASVFNSNNELLETIIITSDNEFYDFLSNLDLFDIVTIDFPIIVTLLDGTQITVNNLSELESTINTSASICDEDDDNDYDDDDCDDCTQQELIDILTSCNDWTVDRLERLTSNNDEDYYAGYTFNFTENGDVVAQNPIWTYNGTWSAVGSGNNIEVVIDIPNLPDCNNNWVLHEIDADSDETKVDLRLGDERLRYESDCSSDGGVDDSTLVNALTNGDWYITYFFDDVDETSSFIDFVFNFSSNNLATATDMSGSINGSWSTTSGDDTLLGLNLNFGTEIPLDELADDWDVLEVTNDIIRLKDVSGGDGSEDFLTFERNPFDGGNGSDDLENILIDGLWFVASYTEDADDQTANYTGYEINFNIDGNVFASNGSNTNYGSWAVLNGGNQMSLDFSTDMPFEEFNDDDWDVISASNTEVIIQDVSGGGGGTDTLILQKL